jgi:dipeptidyl aminopeptidase/acylaminoacyl peptidase
LVGSINFNLKNAVKISLLILAGIAFFLMNACQNEGDCKSRISYENININRGIDLDSLFAPADSAELSTIVAFWSNLNLKHDSFFIKDESKYYLGKTILILEHYHQGHKHYGAVLLPDGYVENKQYPLLLWANGLDQSNPGVDVFDGLIRGLNKGLENYIIVIPSFRGQDLITNSERYCSDGFFGDAFDGAAEDALKLLELVKAKFSIDVNRITVCGISRGGTVALLMASRDSTIKNTVAIAGPTYFLSRDVYRRYSKQFRYQFLSKKIPLKDMRQKMIKSSPVYFISSYPNRLLLIHGKYDRVVPLENADKIIRQLKHKENFESIITDDGHGFYNWPMLFDWIEHYN